MKTILLLIFSSLQGLSASLQDDPNFDYDVRFTNPLCQEYKYQEEVFSVSGAKLESKPKGVYCTPTDKKLAPTWTHSPQYKLAELIRDPNTKEIFFAYLSFSNSFIKNELCKAITERNVKVKFVLDSSSDMSLANEVLACQPLSIENKPELFVRGHEGGIGYAHNKLFVINPNDPKKLTFVFSSGNMTSGIVIHHENWHFITVSTMSYFGQKHLCLIEGVLNAHTSKASYSQFIKNCISKIALKEESDMKSFFIPGEGYLASKTMLAAIKKSDKVEVAAHRFSFGKMLGALKNALYYGTKVRIITDDDIYWASKGETVGDNTIDEFNNVDELVKSGAQNKYFETNHTEHYLHHNKFLVFSKNNQVFGVFAGAGNLTTTAFNDNFENFYYISVPKVREAFKVQYQKMWNEMGTKPEDMPTTNVMP